MTDGERVTLDDVEVALWRGMGLKETETVDRVLKIVADYAEGLAAKVRSDMEAVHALEKAREGGQAVPYSTGIALPNRLPAATEQQGALVCAGLPKDTVFGPVTPDTFLPRPGEEFLRQAQHGPVCPTLPMPVPVDAPRQYPYPVGGVEWPVGVAEDAAYTTDGAKEWPHCLVDEEESGTSGPVEVEGPGHAGGTPRNAGGAPALNAGGTPVCFSREESPLQEPEDAVADGAEPVKDGYWGKRPEDEELAKAAFDMMLARVVDEQSTQVQQLKCSRCEKVKAVEEFAVDRSRPRGRRWRCRACESAGRKPRGGKVTES